MKKVLFILALTIFVMIPLLCSAQIPRGYTEINSKYTWGTFNPGHIIVGGSSFPGVNISYKDTFAWRNWLKSFEWPEFTIKSMTPNTILLPWNPIGDLKTEWSDPPKKIELFPKAYVGNGDLSTALPGDTVVLNAGVYGDFDFSTASDLVFINKGQVTINSFSPRKGTKNIKVLGNGTPSIKYGIKVIGKSRFGFDWESTGTFEIAYCDITSTAIGLKISTLPGQTYPVNNQVGSIHDNYIHNTGLEGIYAGRDDLGGVFITARIYNNLVENSGNDGIQCRNGAFIIEDNVVNNYGIKPAFAYDVEGILIGGNTNSSTIRRNIVGGINNGNAIFNDGFGEQIIECNILTSKLSAIYVNNYHPNEDLQGVKVFNLKVLGNTIVSGQKSLEANFANNTTKFTILYAGNKTSQTPYFDPGIIVTQSNNGASVVLACSGVTPPPIIVPPPVVIIPPKPTPTIINTIGSFENGVFRVKILLSDSTWRYQ